MNHVLINHLLEIKRVKQVSYDHCNKKLSTCISGEDFKTGASVW